MILSASAAATLTALGLAVAPPLQVAVNAPGHSPKIKVHWPYTVKATVAGKPTAGTITAEIVDPIGGVHIVEFGASTKLVQAWHFKGTFSDYLVWPANARGVPLTFRVIVKADGASKTVDYHVTPTR